MRPALPRSSIPCDTRSRRCRRSRLSRRWLAGRARGVIVVVKALDEGPPCRDNVTLRDSAKFAVRLTSAAASAASGLTNRQCRVACSAPTPPCVGRSGVRHHRPCPALGHYERLYFAVQAYDNADHYGYACPDGIENHLATVDQLDCRTTGSCVYLWVDDAAACRTLEVLTESDVKSRVLP